MMELLSVLPGVFRNGLSMAREKPLRRHKPGKPYRTTGVYLPRRYPDLRAKTEAEAIGEACRAIAEDIGAINALEETALRFLASGDDGIGMMGGMLCNMLNSLIN